MVIPLPANQDLTPMVAYSSSSLHKMPTLVGKGSYGNVLTLNRIQVFIFNLEIGRRK